MRRPTPSRHAAVEGIQHDGEVGELLEQADVGDVRHPEMVDAAQHHAARRFDTTRQPWRELVVSGTNGSLPQA